MADHRLYDSTICRLCGEDNDGGTLIYSLHQNNKSLADTINSYLPVKVRDDGKLPRTICPGCSIQIEGTIEFFDLIAKGQEILRDLYKKEQDFLKEQTDPLAVPEISFTEMYPDDHPMSLKAAGLEKPKRKRGRPPKKVKSQQELEKEILETEKELMTKKMETEEPSGKRRRKTPTRFKEVVQGEELERILIQEGVATGDSDGEGPEPPRPPPAEPEVIGHLAASGELVLMAKGKGRGRPKGTLRQQRFVCSVCEEAFTCSGRYMRHVAAHGPVTYQCRQCGADYGNKLQLDTHQRDAAHEGWQVIKQEQQQPETTTEETVEGRVSPAPEEDSLILESDDKGNLKQEINVDVDKVETEGASLTEGEQISEQTNEEECVSPSSSKKRLKCNFCDKEYNSRQSKSLHIKACHKGERPYSCNECGAKFAYPRSLTLHRITHKKKTGHGKGYACDLCGKVLNHPSSVIYHKESEHAGHRYVCNKCNKSFKHKQLLQRHQLVHSQARPYLCKLCPASFKTKANLINHSVLHTGSKRFVCPQCKQRFSHKTSLTLHMRWHQGIKPFTCNFCSKSFTQKGNLSEHVRIHTGERPYPCTRCPKSFTTSSQRRLHILRHDNANNKLQNLLKSEQSECGCADMKLCPHKLQLQPVNKAFKPALKPANKPNRLSLLMSSDRSPEAVPCDDADDDENVIYVAYDIDDGDDGVQILGTEQVLNNKMLAPAFFPGSSLLVQEPLQRIANQIQIDTNHIDLDPGCTRIQIGNRVVNSRVLGGSEIVLEDDVCMPAVETIEIEEPSLDGLPELMEPPRIPVTDEAGNPLHFTMSDGTRLAITSVDGKSLQVVTHDGQTIPVEINNIVNEEITNDSETIVHHLNLQKSVDPDCSQDSQTPVTHYFTIV